MNSKELQSYKDQMDFPMENLAIALYGLGDGGPECLPDHEIVEIAARKIRTMKSMILSTGFKPEMLDAIMQE